MSKGTTPRPIRINDDLWAQFGEAAPTKGARSQIIRDLITEYIATRQGEHHTCEYCTFTSPKTPMGAASMRRHTTRHTE